MGTPCGTSGRGWPGPGWVASCRAPHLQNQQGRSSPHTGHRLLQFQATGRVRAGQLDDRTPSGRKGGAGPGQANLLPLPAPACEVGSPQPLLRSFLPAVAELYKGNCSPWTPSHNRRAHRSRLWPTEEHVFLWGDHTEESGSLLFPESGLRWPWSLSQIRDPWPR